MAAQQALVCVSMYVRRLVGQPWTCLRGRVHSHLPMKSASLALYPICCLLWGAFRFRSRFRQFEKIGFH